MFIGVQCALLPGKEGVAEKASSKKNDADNKGNCCHGETMYSLPLTIVKREDGIVLKEGLTRANAVH